MRIFNVDHSDPAARPDIAARLLPGETVEAAFTAGSSAIFFTDRRIVTVHLQTLLAERRETTSFSYREMRHFSLLEGAPGESRTELRIWIGDDPQPLHLRAGEGADLEPLHLFLAGKLR